MTKRKKIIGFGLIALLLSPIALFLLLALLIYLPPVQQWAVNRAADALSETMGMTVRVEQIRLAFPLDLAIHRVTAIEKNDTVLDARSLRLNVRMLPLLHGEADIDGLELYNVKLNTLDHISDTHIKGSAAELTAAAHGVNWQQEVVRLNHVSLKDADFTVTLSDTAQADTSKNTTRWVIDVEKAQVVRSNISLRMPGDSMRIYAGLNEALLLGGHFDTGRAYYAVKRLTLRDCEARYDLPYLQPTNGLDPNHIGVSDLSLCIDTLSYDSLGVLRTGVRGLSLKEKCGLAIDNVNGSIYMDQNTLRLPAFHLATPASRIDADVALDFRSLESGKGGQLHTYIDADLGAADIVTLARPYVDRATLRALSAGPLRIRADLSGNLDHLRIGQLQASMPGIINLSGKGYASHLTGRYPSGECQFEAHLGNLRVVRELLPKSVTQSINVPDGIDAKGVAQVRAGDYQAHVTLRHGGGRIEAKAHVNQPAEQYQLTAQAVSFPINHFVKGMDIGAFTGKLRATGRGFDVLSSRAQLTADAEVKQLRFSGYELGGTQLNADVNGSKAKAQFNIHNALIETSGTLTAAINRTGYQLWLDAAVPRIDMKGLGVAQNTLDLSSHINVEAYSDKNFTAYGAKGCIDQNFITTDEISNLAKDINFDVATSKDTTTAHIAAGDLVLALGAKGNMDWMTKNLTKFTSEVNRQMDAREIDQEALKRLLPVIHFVLEAGQANPLYNFLRMKGYSFNAADIHLDANPSNGLSGNVNVGALQVGGVLLDTIDTYLVQDSTGIQCYGMVKNNRKNPTPLMMKLKSYLRKTGAGIELAFLDSRGRTGVNLGIMADMVEQGINLHLYPHHPILAYREFTVNQDNFVLLGNDRSISANMDLLADDGTGLKIFGEPSDSINDLSVSINQVNLGELSNVIPYLPKMGGRLSGDFHVSASKDYSKVSGVGSINADDFSYEGVQLGQIGMEAIYLPKAGGEHHASAFISASGTEVLDLNGTYYDRDGGHFEGDATLHDFPLHLLDGFLAGTDVGLKGIASGELKLKGTFDKPVINGALDLNSSHIYSDVYGFDFRTDERKVEINDSRLLFKNYNLYSTGKEPLVLNGSFDMSNLDRMKLDLALRANRFELINTQKKAKSVIFGKVYTNFIGTVKGTTDNLAVRGKVDILDQTNMTYILKDSPLSVDNRLDDLVQFVDFADSTYVAPKKRYVQGGFDLTLGIAINDAAQFHCNLSEDGQSYVNLEGGGDLTFRMTQSGDMSMTGRFTANSGQMKYALPVIPLKTFNLVQGSNVLFTGDVMNPTLNIAAKERTKAVVTENDKQRSVAFDVGVKITKPLNEMGLEFTIEAPEDLGIQNELASMSKEQRGKAAVAMMATGMYMTDESLMSGSGFKANNALNAFLQNEIQHIAGSALRTIDINFGVESGTGATGQATTDYSFQFAKRFWGNRFSVIIGGKVSTGADAKNSAESFINNVSLEYRLDQSATRYIKAFYDRDTQDPLEGQLTKTGAGLVLRRKTDKLGELFLFKKKKNPVTPPYEDHNPGANDSLNLH